MADSPSSALPSDVVQTRSASRPRQSRDWRISKRKNASVACNTCRAFRTKCAGSSNSPCTNCVRRGTECTYDESVDKRRQRPSKISESDKSGRRKAIETIIDCIRTRPFPAAYDLVYKVRSGVDPQTLAANIVDQAVVQQELSEYNDPNSCLPTVERASTADSQYEEEVKILETTAEHAPEQQILGDPAKAVDPISNALVANQQVRSEFSWREASDNNLDSSLRRTQHKDDPIACFQSFETYDANERLPRTIARQENSNLTGPGGPMALDPNMCKQLSQLVISGHSQASQSSEFKEIQDMHILIVGTVQGWEIISKQLELDAHWDYIRGMDKLIEPVLSLMDRFSSLIYMRKAVRYYSTSDVSEQALIAPHVPTFLWKTDLQATVEHPEIFDYFPWPGLRQRAIRNPSRYDSDSFFDAHLTNFRFLWPHKDEDSFFFDPYTQMFRFTMEFSRNVADIRSWTACATLFDEYPELRPVIPQFEESLSLCKLRNNEAEAVRWWREYHQRKEVKRQKGPTGNDDGSGRGRKS